MLKERPPRTVPLRYSPKPISAYNIVLPGGVAAGPGDAVFLRDDVEAWNLAYLSHPYELRAEHRDAEFTVLVRRTVNTTLSGGRLDMLGHSPATLTVRGLLRLPAPEFIEAITRGNTAAGERLLDRLPLYAAYGEPWLATCKARAALCLRAPVSSEFEPGDEVPDVAQAQDLLRRILK